MALFIPESILSTLEDATKLTRVPYLQDAAVVALRIIQITQDVKSHKEAFQQLAKDAGGLVYIILHDGDKDTVGVAGLTPIYLDHSKELLNTLQEIYVYTRSHASANGIIRIIQHQSVIGTIHDYYDRLKQILNLFHLGSGISIQDALATSVQKQILELAKRQQDRVTTQTSPLSGNEHANERPVDQDQIEDRNSEGESLESGEQSVQEDEMSRNDSDPNISETHHPRGQTRAPSFEYDRGSRPSFHQQRSYYDEQFNRTPPSGYYYPYSQRHYGTTTSGVPRSASAYPGLFSPIPGPDFPGSYTIVRGAQNTYTNTVAPPNATDSTTYNVSNTNNDSSVRNYEAKPRRR